MSPHLVLAWYLSLSERSRRLTPVGMFIREKEQALPPWAALMLHETLLYTSEIILHETKEKEVMVSIAENTHKES